LRWFGYIKLWEIEWLKQKLAKRFMTFKRIGASELDAILNPEG